MKFLENNPPRKFPVGNSVKFEMSDCGSCYLENDEQITFKTQNGLEYDVAKKDFGFYATPSLNGRLSSFGLRTVLIKNTNTNRYFIFLVEKGKESLFDQYCMQESLIVIHWLDSDENCKQLEDKCK
jgi:hypothetical protein